MKLNSSIVRGIIRCMENKNLDIRDFIRDPEVLRSIYEQEMVDAMVYFKLVTEVKKTTPNTRSYYELFKGMHVLDMGIVGHLQVACKNIFSGFDKMTKYQLFLSDFIEIKYQKLHNDIHYMLKMPYQLMKHDYDMEAIADFELIFRLMIIETLAVRVPQVKQLDLFVTGKNDQDRVSFFSELLGCPIITNKHFNVIVYEPDEINQDIRYANYTLYKHLDILFNNRAAEMYDRGEYKNIIRSILLNNLEEFPLTVNDIAKRLAVSTRKLQEILQNENTSYLKILNEVKIIYATELIRRNKEIKKIAFALGYNETNSFTRYFRSMMGISPARYKNLPEKERMEIMNSVSY